MTIQELTDNPYSLPEPTEFRGSYHYTITTDDNSELGIVFMHDTITLRRVSIILQIPEKILSEKYNCTPTTVLDGFEFLFKRNDDYSVTGGGDAFRIFATIKEAILTFTKEMNNEIDFISYIGSEKSRIKMYNIATPVVTKKLGYLLPDGSPACEMDRKNGFYWIFNPKHISSYIKNDKL